MSEQESPQEASDSSSLISIISNPSNVIKHCEKVIDISGASIHLTLVTMKRSFLLVINNAGSGDYGNAGLSKEDMIRGFMGSNNALKGLSLAIGEHNTSLTASDSSLVSATLASRLSKKINNNRPVYVANNFDVPYDTVDSSGFMAKLYLKIFQFVGANYESSSTNDTK